MDAEHLVLCTLFFYLSLIQNAFSSLKDVTSEVGLGATSDAVLAAFGDFNSDKKADLFLISNSEGKSKVEVYLWNTDDDEFQKTNKASIYFERMFITNVIPGDFNGDGHLDVLMAYYNTTLSNKEEKTFVKLLLGKDSHFEDSGIHVDLQDALHDQPAIVDFNGDLHPDLLGEKESDGKRYWWKYNDNNRTFESHSMKTRNQYHLSKPHSCAFLDLNGDYTADIFIPVLKNGTAKEVEFEVWLNKEGVFESPSDSDVYKPPGESEDRDIGQSTFADLDGDGLADHLLPVCYSNCSRSEIHVYSKTKKKWVPILTSDASEEFSWNFFKGTRNGQIPSMTLRIGDHNLDGYPDAAAIVEIQTDKQAPEIRVVLLENVECSDGSGCFHGRKFRINWNNHILSSINNPLMVGFFDLNDNGILDLLIVTDNSNGTDQAYQIHAIQNSVYWDTCFLKVIVLGSSCFSSCPSGVTPYGVNQAGAYVKYVTTGSEGDTKKSSATQLSQSAYFALQPPYTVFGLGRTPNFVEKLVIGLPRSRQSPARRRTWTSLIPNSQIIIIPYPPDDPDEWKSKLLLTPGRLVLVTGGALLATCVFIGAIVALLHWKEKREDRKEKQEAAHKFHFDAM